MFSTAGDKLFSFGITPVVVDVLPSASLSEDLSTKSELLYVSSEHEDNAEENGFHEGDDTRPYFKWSSESTKLLLSLRFRKDTVFRSPKSKKKQLWDSLADSMYQIGGYRISGVLCDLKFRNMMHTYKKNRQKEQNGNSIAWEYYQIFKDAVGNKFGESRNSISNSMLFDDTMMEPPNETMFPATEARTNNENMFQSNNIHHPEDDTNVPFQPCKNEASYNDGEEFNNATTHNAVEVTETPLTEDEKKECVAFGNSIGCQLQNIKDSYTRALVKLKMQKIMFLAQTGRLALNNERL